MGDVKYTPRYGTRSARMKPVGTTTQALAQNPPSARFSTLVPGSLTSHPWIPRELIFHALIFVAAFLIIYSRRPDAIANAQFFAEDGEWYVDAYQYGIRSLLMPDPGGYLHIIPRLVALLSLSFPFRLAPLVMNLCAISIQILPVNLFVSSRFVNIALPMRLLASLLYLVLPNSFETNANVTTSQWHLALLACMVLLARPTNERRWQVFDGLVLVLISIESPIGVLLLPVAAALWWIRRSRISAIALAFLFPGAVIQVLTVLLSHSRQAAANGASMTGLITILGGQIFLPSLLGRETLVSLVAGHPQHSLLIAESIATIVGLALLLYAVRRGPTELKLFVVFAFAVLALALIHPLAAAPNQTQWESLSVPGCGNRYYFLPMIAFFAALFWIVSNVTTPQSLRCCAGVLLLLLPFGIRRDWRYQPFVDLHFREYASEFESLPSGAKLVIPLNPVNSSHWAIEVSKH